MGAKHGRQKTFDSSSSERHVSLPPFPHSYTVGATTTSPLRPASSVCHPILHLARAATLPRHALQEMDVSHPWRWTRILSSPPLASSAPSSTLPLLLLRPPRPRQHDISPNPAACRLKYSSPPPTAIAPVAPSTYQYRPTQRRNRGGTLPYVLKLLISPGK